MSPTVFSWVVRPSLVLALSLFAGCSPGAPACEGGSCDAADAAPASRCYLAALPACEGGNDRYSDEACLSLDDRETRVPAVRDATRAPIVLSPTQNEALPAATAPTFRWSVVLASRLRDRAAPQIAWLSTAPRPARAMTFTEELSRWLTLIPEAQAHCAPFSGVGYGVDFISAGRVLLRVEQSRTEYTPTSAAWAQLRAATGPIEMRITAARFRNNEVTEGPYESVERRTFTIVP
ncbi:MAG: hypothetical protein Q8Q09_18115 [Deltaproteobacteria bacterium]|nr:hypothetical protein [Deltaproteobacteria bacterium]